jgi:colicin import membrane protein
MRGSTKIIVATILSTVIHFFVLTLFDTIPLISKEVPQRNLYMVDLVPLPVEQPAPQQAEKPAVQQKVEEVKKEEVKKEEVKKEEVKEEVKKEEPKQETVKKEEVKKTPPKDDEVVLADTDNKQENKEETEEQAPNPEEKLLASIEKIKKDVAAREQGDSQTPEATAAEIDQYVTMVENRVKELWVIPDLLSARELKAVVVFAIDEKGQVTNLRFKESSGNSPYDQSVLRAISKAVPFSPPPQVLLKEEYELTFEPKL